jgi:hypothetical protein
MATVLVFLRDLLFTSGRLNGTKHELERLRRFGKRKVLKVTLIAIWLFQSFTTLLSLKWKRLAKKQVLGGTDNMIYDPYGRAIRRPVGFEKEREFVNVNGNDIEADSFYLYLYGPSLTYWSETEERWITDKDKVRS